MGYTDAFNPAAYWVEVSAIFCLGIGHYLLWATGPTVFPVGSFPLVRLTGLAIGLAAHSMWLVGRLFLPVTIASFFAGQLAFGETLDLVYLLVPTVATIGTGVAGYRW